MAIAGGSHGGLLTGHLVGQHPSRFRAGALRNPVMDVSLMVHVSDIPDWCYCEGWGAEVRRGGARAWGVWCARASGTRSAIAGSGFDLELTTGWCPARGIQVSQHVGSVLHQAVYLEAKYRPGASVSHAVPTGFRRRCQPRSPAV